jgi:hypothetical protein
MDKFFDIVTEFGVIAMLIICGIASLIGGCITGMLHCFIIAAVALFIPYVWYVEDYQKKGKSLWQKRNSKN